MALTTYRSIVPINTAARRRAAYDKARDLFDHADAYGYDVRRIEYIPATQYIEVDLTVAVTAAQAAHLGLEGPI